MLVYKGALGYTHVYADRLLLSKQAFSGRLPDQLFRTAPCLKTAEENAFYGVRNNPGKTCSCGSSPAGSHTFHCVIKKNRTVKNETRL